MSSCVQDGLLGAATLIPLSFVTGYHENAHKQGIKRKSESEPASNINVDGGSNKKQVGVISLTDILNTSQKPAGPEVTASASFPSDQSSQGNLQTTTTAACATTTLPPVNTILPSQKGSITALMNIVSEEVNNHFSYPSRETSTINPDNSPPSFAHRSSREDSNPPTPSNNCSPVTRLPSSPTPSLSESSSMEDLTNFCDDIGSGCSDNEEGPKLKPCYCALCRKKVDSPFFSSITPKNIEKFSKLFPEHSFKLNQRICERHLDTTYREKYISSCEMNKQLKAKNTELLIKLDRLNTTVSELTTGKERDNLELRTTRNELHLLRDAFEKLDKKYQGLLLQSGPHIEETEGPSPARVTVSPSRMEPQSVLVPNTVYIAPSPPPVSIAPVPKPESRGVGPVFPLQEAVHPICQKPQQPQPQPQYHPQQFVFKKTPQQLREEEERQKNREVALKFLQLHRERQQVGESPSPVDKSQLQEMMAQVTTTSTINNIIQTMSSVSFPPAQTALPSHIVLPPLGPTSSRSQSI